MIPINVELIMCGVFRVSYLVGHFPFHIQQLLIYRPNIKHSREQFIFDYLINMHSIEYRALDTGQVPLS
jgi:hypothetical protein